MDANCRLCGGPATFPRLTVVLWLVVCCGVAGVCAVGEMPARGAEPTVEQAVERGLAYLANRQHEDGAYGAEVYRGHVAVTAFVGRAMMASGSKPGSGPYGDHVAKCRQYLLSRIQDNGMITSKDAREPAPMYGHAFALTFLAECQKAAPLAEAREKLARAVQLTVKSQNKEGGWRYLPRPEDADLSVTVTQLMALAAARDAGLDVPPATIDRAIEYVKKSQNKDGGFRYLIQGGMSGFARSAAAVAALYRAGAEEGPEIRKGIDYVARFPAAGGVGQPEFYYFYGHYYAAQAMSHAGEEAWNRWYNPVRDELIKQQVKDGSWPDTASVDLGTAMACLTLRTKIAGAAAAAPATPR